MARFSVRARAVDMLGRQQIAGVPTAIHELFKNAHDAYATLVEVDFIRVDNRLVVRDNGLGMTEADFTNRWLALGTESKFGVNAETMARWTGPERLPTRPLMGEKGIGRLAIATIAPVTFVLSRAVREDAGVSDITACLVCWKLFELPGIDLEAIEIPLRTFSELPCKEDVAGMIQEVKSNIREIVSDESIRDELLLLMDRSALDPVEFDDWFSRVAEEVDEPNLSLLSNRYGTHFFLSQCDESLSSDIDSAQSDGASPIKQMLLGFGNTMSTDYKPPIQAEFRDHKATGNFDELIGGDEFFSAADLERCDHLFEGEFDDFGQFHGVFRIYRGDPEPYVLSWPEAKGKPISCGRFKLRLGVIQGQAQESMLDPESHQELDQKMRRLGGLYVYRDGIRILPYGRTEFDWLGIEHRRTMSASDWFFSHRRMAGYIALNRDDNAALSEKAGREGFRQNRAYRDLQAVLDNWFKQVAKDFFRKTSERSPRYREIVDVKRREAELLVKRKKKASQLKAEFRTKLNARHDEIESGVHETAVKQLIESAVQKFEFLESNYRGNGNGRESTGLETVRIEDDVVADLERTSRHLQMPRPRQFSPTKADLNALEAYLGWLNAFEENVLEPAIGEVRGCASQLRQKLDFDVSRSERARSALEREADQLLGQMSSLKKEVVRDAGVMFSSIKNATQSRFDDFSNKIEGLKAELQKTDLDGIDTKSALKMQRELERFLDSAFSDASAELKALLHQVQTIDQSVNDNDLLNETIAALEGRISDLEEQLSFYNDLAQAGSAISVIGHELENVVSGLRAAIRDIKPWADGTPELGGVYERLRTYYDHLDSYVGLFSPLSRRVRRRKVFVTGSSILNYVEELFGERLSKAEIELRATDSFRQQVIESYRSTLIAAVVNVVDNAIYWINSDRHAERWIELDAHGTGIVIKNGGPGIPRRAADSIFEFGVSSKPGGRGMGLAVSREALESIGLELSLLEPGLEAKPAFAIQPSAGEDDNND